jgi:aminoglycoside phosphotransferase (APT) family kinase protein
MQPAVDTIEARRGDELPKELEVYLKHALNAEGEYHVSQFPGGYSNLTYLIRIGSKRLVLRRPPRGVKAKSAHDMGREFLVLQHLKGVMPEIPEPLHFCADESIIGSSFYVMGFIAGFILRKEWPEGFDLTLEQQKLQMRNVVGLQARLHGLNYQKLGLETFGQPDGYAQRQVQGWVKRYRASRTEDAPEFEDVMGWLEREVITLPERKGCLIHNDYKLDNLVFDPTDPTRILGLLDWEMATLGDPLMDLGNSLAYWVEPKDPAYMHAFRTLPSHKPGYPDRAEQLRWYAELSGRAIERWNFYATFGLFRLAVIAQQIYQRFKLGQSADERFSKLIHGVMALEKACGMAMKLR